jgi:hypothetical protein
LYILVLGVVFWLFLVIICKGFVTILFLMSDFVCFRCYI